MGDVADGLEGFNGKMVSKFSQKSQQLIGISLIVVVLSGVGSWSLLVWCRRLGAER